MRCRAVESETRPLRFDAPAPRGPNPVVSAIYTVMLAALILVVSSRAPLGRAPARPRPDGFHRFDATAPRGPNPFVNAIVERLQQS
jgi:hypothetical protein